MPSLGRARRRLTPLVAAECPMACATGKGSARPAANPCRTVGGTTGGRTARSIPTTAETKGSGIRCRRLREPPSPARRDDRHRMNDARRGNYDSGEDFVLEYGEL